MATTTRDRRDLAQIKKLIGRGHPIGGIGSDGKVYPLRIEEFTGRARGYGGVLLAAHEQVPAFGQAGTELRSGFALVAGGRVSLDGTVPTGDQGAAGQAQRILVDADGKVWVVAGTPDPTITTLATTLAPSVFGTAYGSLVTTTAADVAGATRVRCEVSYTPAADDDKLWVYPQLSIQTPASYSLLQQLSSVAKPRSGPTLPPTVTRSPQGYSSYAPFDDLTTAAATAVTASFELAPDDWQGALSLRFALRSTALVGPGTVTMRVAVTR